jgi:hypothetical protein
VTGLMDDPVACATLRANTAQLALRNGVDTATDAVARLFVPDATAAGERT